MGNKNKLYSIALASAVLVIAFLILISVASSSQVTRIGNGTDPSIYGSNAVWTDKGVIHVYDLATKNDTTVDSSAASYPAIYGNELVWHDYSSGIPRLAVYDTKTAARSYITEDVDRSSVPYIYGNRIVWSANDSVYLRDISTSTQEKVGNGRDPDIYDTKIVYYSYREEPEKDMTTIRIYDINTKEKITVTSSGDPNLPHIWGNKVIWSDAYNHMGYIAMYDTATKNIIDITQPLGTDPYGNEYGASTGTHIDIQNDKIVYHKSADDYEGKPGVYVYNISTGQSTLISNYPEEIYTTPEVYNDTVVWGIGSNYGDATIDNGIYVVNLSATNTLPPVAEFTANVTSGTAPLVVLFTDIGTGESPASWLWDFGDGTNSKHSMNATHTFTNPGSYTISLTVENSAGNSTVIKKNYIVATDSIVTYLGIPIANFSTNVTHGRVPLTVQFIDLSQNATSISWDVNGDGIEDSNASSFVYEYTSEGIYTAKLTAINANGTDTASTIISVARRSSGSSSGGGGGSPEPAKNVEVKELSQVFITNGKAAKFDFTKNATYVVYVGFDAKKTVGKTTTIVEQLKNKSTLTSNLTNGEVYKYFNVWVGNSGFASSDNIENRSICFKVEKSWLKDKNIDQNSITLNRYEDENKYDGKDGTWTQLPVSLLKEDSKYLYFTVDVPGYTFFAITGKEIAKETITETQSESQKQNPEEKTGITSDMEQKPEQEKTASLPGFVMIYGMVSLFVLYMCKRK